MNAPTDGVFLLCVDLQPVFLDAIEGAAQTLRRCAFAIAAVQGLGLGLGFTEQVPEKLGGTAPSLRALAPRAPVWGKRTFSALSDERVRAALRRRKADHLLLCGLETPVCIYQTAREALALDFRVTVLADAICARRAEDAATALAAVARAGADVLPSETVFYGMLGDAGHPWFREYTKLVKNHA